MRKLWKKVLAGLLVAGMMIAPVSGTVVANAEPDTLLIAPNPNAGKTWDFSVLNKEFGGPGIEKEGDTTTYSGLVLKGEVTEQREYLNLKEGAVVSVPVKKGDIVTISYCYEAAFQIGTEVPATHKVVRGDTLSQIARKYSLTLNGILKLNPAITNPDVINVGQVINLAAAKAAVSVDVKSGDINKVEEVTYTATADGYVDIKAVKGTKAAQTLLTKIVVGKEQTSAEPTIAPTVAPTTTPVVPTDADAILDAAYALEKGATMEAEVSLTGVITKVNTKWSSQYKNITVTIVVNGDTERPIMCYRLKGEGAETLAVGDTITATGKITNYNGTIEFAAGCVVSNIVKGEGVEVEVMTDAKAILEAAYALGEGDYLSNDATLTGKVTKVKTEYSDYYKNITVIIEVPGFAEYPIECFRLAGEGADKIHKGDIVTVTGTLMNFYGTIEFDQGCTLDKLEDISDGSIDLSTPQNILEAAYDLASGAKLETATLDGYIIAINDEYSSKYKNITVTIQLDAYPDKPVMCYRLKGEGAETLKVGDYIGVTGAITNYKGTIEFNSGCTLDYVVKLQPDPRPETPQEIMDAAYALEKGADLAGGNYTLTGVITAVNTAYNSSYGNVTVTMTVDGTSKSIKCYRLAGTGADVIGVGDTITVTGEITNYNGNIQFKQGCTLDSYVENTLPTTPEEIMDAAYALGSGESLAGSYTLTGVITAVNTAYSSQYGNVTVTMTVGSTGKSIKCYRLAGTGADVIAVGDTITVSGTITNYKGTSVQFAQGCTLDSYMKVMTEAEIMDAAYALGSGESLAGTHTLTGVITAVNTAYSSQYGNVTVTMTVGSTGKSIKCYRLAGTGADVIAVGDTITVTGTITNYKGTSVQFTQGCTLDSYVKAQ